MSSRSGSAPVQRPAATILFVCLHGSAKSLIAARHFNRLAEARGLTARGESLGVEPDADVPANVVAGLAADGFELRGYVPRRLTGEELARASRVISFGCDLTGFPPAAAVVEHWTDLPMVSDGYAAARDAIVARIGALIERLER